MREPNEHTGTKSLPQKELGQKIKPSNVINSDE
jgi:hypothetical protein